ncbi:hypothetical protein ACSBM8_18095 [Sphingomonas sp. ASY06-1R]|uniref:hypothetical protein n=1 Tax=Sphingomonas sp. ASY06-1R TaxID=3445771 RepID=UPI003FA2DFDD
MMRLAVLLTAVILCGVPYAPATASGPDPLPYSFIHNRGGEAQDRDRLYRGNMGVFLPTGSDGRLYLQWRLMNGLDITPAIGDTLNRRCCVSGGWPDSDDAIEDWIGAVRSVTRVQPSETWIATDRPGTEYGEVQNCFGDAFHSAAATLKERAARYGRQSAAVRAWLATQNAVFAACSDPKATLPAPLANAPQWLRADRAYQEAAFALYQVRIEEAFRRFRAIAADPTSPWASRGLYLSARVMYHAALLHRSPDAYKAARAAIAPLQARPGAYGYGEVRIMLRALAFRYRPALLFGKLDQELNAKVPVPDLARGVRDYVNLSERLPTRPDLADWLATLRNPQRAPALAHASERWAATRKQHWLVLALTLARPDDPQAATLAAAALQVPRSSAAWKTAQYHQLRLTIAHGDPAALRARVDTILVSELSSTDRNLFEGIRAQLATSLPDLMRFAVRRVFCPDYGDKCPPNTRFNHDPSLAARRPGSDPVALAPDAKAILDRLPLHSRMTVGAGLPREFRLDLALTNFGRAVQLQDDAAIDQLAAELAVLLPAIRQDWLTIRHTPPGPAKRFAEFFVLAKIPGMSPDFAGYTRPEGTPRQWQGDWWDWMILPRPARARIDPPDASRYNLWESRQSADQAHPDLVCGAYCGASGFPLHLPQFAIEAQPRARVERSRLLFYNDDNKAKLPPGSVSAWASLLEYARAHPRDPRSPEACYWLIRITRWRTAHDRIGYKAFRLLHTVHPRSIWTKRSPLYFD